MFTRTTTTYTVGAVGLGYGTTSVEGRVLDEAQKANSTIGTDTIWYDLFSSAIDAGTLTQVDGKFFYDGIMVSDIFSIALAVGSTLIVGYKLISEIYFSILKRRLLKLEAELDNE